MNRRMPGPVQPEEHAALREPEPRDLAGMVLAMRRHLPTSVAIVLACLALALLSVLLPRIYTAEATLSYDPQLPLIKGGGGLAMTDAQRDAEIDAQLAEVASPPVAQDVAQAVDLAANPKLQQEAEAWAVRSDHRLTRDEALGTALLDHVKAQRVGQTPVFTIGFSAATAAQAARIANLFAASYLKVSTRQQVASTEASARQIAVRVAELRQQAIAAERDLAAFRIANNLLDNSDSVALEQEVATLRGELAEARGQAALAGTRSAAAGKATVVGGGGSGTVDTTPVSALIQQHAASAADLAALLARYGERYPAVIAARKRSAEVDAQMATAMQGNRNSAEVEAQAATSRVQTLASSLADAEGRLGAMLSHGSQLADLQNSAQAARQAYQDVLKVSADQVAQRALIQPYAQVIAPAQPPLRPKFPRLGINLLVGLALGLGVSLAVAFIREMWVHTLGSADDIARWLGIDYFAPLPRLGSALRHAATRDPLEAASLHPRSAYAESFRSLGAAAMFLAANSETTGARVIGLTSALPGEGVTTASLAMARLLAASGMKVSQRDAGEGDGLTDQIASLRRDHDVVIIDLGPVLAGCAPRPLLESLDALVFLVRWRSTPVATIREALRRIVTAGGTVSGIALSMVEGGPRERVR